jgi:hypothetical protein
MGVEALVDLLGAALAHDRSADRAAPAGTATVDRGYVGSERPADVDYDLGSSW